MKLPYGLDKVNLVIEYFKVLDKRSNLSKRQRDYVKTHVEANLDNYFYDDPVRQEGHILEVERGKERARVNY